MEKNRTKVTDMVEIALFAAIIILLSATPIGYIPLGAINATTIHIPVILAGVVLGCKKGAVTGFIFGLTSFVNASFIKPVASSFLFTPLMPGGNGFSLIICFVPRILIGVVACLVFKLLIKTVKNKYVSLAVAGVAGSMTNTILVMSMAYLFFSEKYAEVLEIPVHTVLNYIIGVICINGVLEAICAGILTVAVGSVLLVVQKQRKNI